MLLDKTLGSVGILFIGKFDINTEYEYLNAVTYAGSTYVCICEEGAKGKEPKDTDCWILSAKAPEKGIDYFTKDEKAEIISGLQQEITNTNKLNSDLVDDNNSINKFVTNKEKEKWNGKAELNDIPIKNSDLQNDSEFITNAVENLLNYYKKNETYTKNEINTAIANKIAEIIAEAPESFDTLKEIADWINTHDNSASAMNSAIQANAQNITNLGNAKYEKPNAGIPKTDLASDVQTSLGKADTALQTHQDVSGKENNTNKVTEITNESTNEQYPSALAVYNYVNDIVGDINSILDYVNGEVV